MTHYNEYTIKGIRFHRINNDINGNPRYVTHFLNLINETDNNQAPDDLNRIPWLYKRAADKAKKIGGKKYRARWFGGGLVFQSYYICGLVSDIKRINKT